jgi:hypothetical protein
LSMIRCSVTLLEFWVNKILNSFLLIRHSWETCHYPNLMVLAIMMTLNLTLLCRKNQRQMLFRHPGLRVRGLRKRNILGLSLVQI